MQRAAEIILKYSHDRPKGGKRSGLLGYLGIGENLCIDTMHIGTKEEAFRLFREDDKPYGKQGHRRMMLSVPTEFDAVGIAFVEYEGEYLWVQEYGVTNSPNTKETQPVNGKKVMNVEISTDYIVDKNIEPIKLTIDDEDTKGLTQDKTVRINCGWDYEYGCVFTYPYGYWDLNVTGEWKSNNEKIAKVIKLNDTYKVKAIGNGTTTIDLVGSNGDIYKSMKVTVNTYEIVPHTFFFDKLLTYNTGETSTISYVLPPENATNKKVLWSSSDTSIATVDANGKVKALKAGKAKITGKTVSGGLTCTGDVIVNDINVAGVKLNKATTMINQGGMEALKVTIAPSDATNKNVTWSSNNTKIATVDKNGNVKAMGAGTATIICKTVDGGETATCKVNVDGWVNNNGKYSYVKDGKKLTGFYYFTSKEGEKTPHWSYFDKNGVLLTGWQWLGKGTNNPDGNNAKHMSYFGDNGCLRTGWQEMGKGTVNSFDEKTAKHWSYFGANGWLRTGWVQLGKGTSEPDGNSAVHWSYFGDNGWLRTGWQEMGNGTNNPDNNKARHWSFFGDNGWLRTGKQTINKKAYTFNDAGWLMNPTKP